jgi:phosphate transport system substrate-binding protein
VALFALAISACAAPITTAPAPADPAAEATEAPAAEATEAPAEEAASEEMATEDGMLPMVNPLELSGDIIIAGSSTVFPLTEVVVERFQNEGFAGNVTIDSIGTGGGFERFCVAGETDIANASRPIRDTEIASCTAINRTPIEFRVGTDALAVVVSAENDFIDNVTLEELALIFSTAENWSDVRPEWPNEPIQHFSPGTDSGTFDYFVEVVFDEDEAPLLNSANLQLSEDDNVLVQGVQGSPFAVGYFGYAYFQENADTLKILSVEGVEPTVEAVEGGEYPLARPLFIYSDATIMAEKPQVAGFINFYLTYVNEEIDGVGYFPASDAALNTAREAWLAANQ